MDLVLSQPKPKLLLADGTGIVRRVFKANKGEDTPARAEGSLKASMGSFLRGLREHEPTHFLAVFDYGGPTWRHHLYPQYKAGREPASVHLTAAMPEFIERMNNRGMRTLSVPGVEADDTITTLALKAVARGFEVIVLANDKDLLYLLTHGIKVYDHFQSELRDAAYVHQRFGVLPHQMTDFLALMGDESDGIPGVEGVGEKIAARLLVEHRDLEGVLAAAPDIGGKLGAHLRASGDIARLSRQLATMRTDIELGITPRDIKIPSSLAASLATMPEPRLVRTAPMLRGEAATPGPHIAPALQSNQGSAAPSSARRLRM